MGRRGRLAASAAGLAVTVILAGGFLVVALNRQGSGPEQSAGDGSSIRWHSTHLRVQLSLSPFLATSGDHLYMAGISGTTGSRVFHVWSSANGTDWTSLAVTGVETDFVPRAAVGDGSGGLIVVGELTPSEAVVPQIWHAADGHTFVKTSLDLSNLALGTASGSGEIVAVAATSGRLVAFGDHDFVSLDKSVGEVRALDAWHSTDGKSWTRVDLPESNGYQARSMTAWGGGFAALASQPSDPEYAVWTSPDGIAWHRAGNPSAFGAASMVAIPGRLVVVGSRRDAGRGMVPAAWSSVDASSWTESAAPVTGFGATFDAAAVVDGNIVAIGASHVAGTDASAGASPSLPPLVPPSAWISTDGSAWQPLGDIPLYQPYLTSMAAFGGRVVIATSAGPDLTVSIGDLSGAGAAASAS
jgi:hypothetical protein